MIYRGEGDIMQVMSIANREDSLLLRRVSEPMDEKMVGSEELAVQRFDKAGEPFEFFLNPEIIAMLGENKPGGEGCLSVPDMRGVVSRSHHIVLRYRDVDFVEHTDTIEGFTAVIFQHEVDHLDGVLYIDKTE